MKLSVYAKQVGVSYRTAFRCLNCGQRENADVNAARNIAKRFGDDEFNQLHYRDVKAVTSLRRLSPDGCSLSAGLDTSPPKVTFEGGESYKKSISPV